MGINKTIDNNLTNTKVLLHAPNVHMGGGLTLLKEILETGAVEILFAQLDLRVKEKIQFPENIKVHYVKATIFSRFLAEWRLYRQSIMHTTVLCFHGLPPLFSLRTKTVVFVQSRILCGKEDLDQFPFKTRMRLYMERLWLRKTNPAIRYIVQTESMAMRLRAILNDTINVKVLPFAPTDAREDSPNNHAKKYDFLYVASGEAHKNHLNLLKAWALLAQQGLRPSLALTVDEIKYSTIAADIRYYQEKFSLNIVNLGVIASSEEMTILYCSSSALIFPSLLESFGLPLIEATWYHLPILAPELDYVRDVIEPFTTFDAHSPVSIARAVRRFLGLKESSPIIYSGSAFWAEITK